VAEHWYWPQPRRCCTGQPKAPTRNL